MRLTTTALSLALFGVVNCASSNRKLSKKSKGQGKCSTFLTFFVDQSDAFNQVSYFGASFKFGVPPTCVDFGDSIEICTGDTAVQQPIPVYTDEGFNIEVAKLVEIRTYVEAESLTKLSSELSATMIFDDNFGSELHAAGFAEINEEDNDLALVGGTGRFEGATGVFDLISRDDGIIEVNVCIL